MSEENEKDWCEVDENGNIDIPDELMPLFNSIGMQIRFLTIVGESEVMTIARILRAAQKFFTRSQEVAILREIARLSNLYVGGGCCEQHQNETWNQLINELSKFEDDSFLKLKPYDRNKATEVYDGKS